MLDMLRSSNILKETWYLNDGPYIYIYICPVLSKCVSSGEIRVLGIYLWKIHVTVTNLNINLKVDIPENSAHHFLFIKVIRNRSMDSLNPIVMDKFCYQGYT